MNFLINSRPCFQTRFGGIITVSFLIITISLAIFLCLDYINNRKYSKSVASLEMSKNFLDFSLEIMIGFPRDLLNSSKFALNDGLFNFKIVPLRECAVSQYDLFTKVSRNSSFFYYCETFSSINSDFFLSFQLISCEMLGKNSVFWQIRDFSCTNFSKQPEFSSAKYWVRHFTYNISETSDFSSDFSVISGELLENDQQMLSGNYNKLRIDDNLLFTDYEEHYFSRLRSSILTKKPETLFSLDIEYEQFFEITLERYKFINLLAEIWGFWNFLYLFCFLASQALAKYYYQRFLVKRGFLAIFPRETAINLDNLMPTMTIEENTEKKHEHALEISRKNQKNALFLQEKALKSFSLSKYLISLIPCQCLRKQRAIRDIIQVQKKILSRISLENYLFSGRISQNGSPIKKIKQKPSKLRDFLCFLDVFGQKKSLVVTSQPFFGSWLGLLLFLARVGVFVVIFVLFGRNLWENNPEIAIMTKNMVNLPENSYIDPISCKFTVSRNFAKSSLLTKLDKETGGLKPFNYSICFENATLISYCFYLSDASGDIFGKNVDNLQTELYFVDCVNLYSIGLDNSSCESFKTNTNAPIYLNFSFISHNYKLKEVYNYRIEEPYSLETVLNYSKEMRSFFILKMIPKHLGSDRNVMINEIHYDVALTTNKFQLAVQELNQRGCFAGLYVEIAYQYLEIQRTFAKIPIIFSYIWTLTMICCLPLLVIEKCFDDFVFLRKFKRIFENQANFFRSFSLEDSQAREKIQNCLSLRTFLRNWLFFWRNRDEDARNLASLKATISFENIPRLLKGLPDDSFLTNSEKKRGIFKRLDMFTNLESPFSVRKQWKFRTSFGGFLTVLFLFSLAVIVYFFGINYLQKINPKINIQNLPATDLQGLYDYIFNIPFIFGVSKSFDHASITNSLYLAREMPKMCEKGKFPLVNTNDFNETMVYYCVDITNLFGGNLFNGSGYFMNILSTYLNCDAKNSSCSQYIQNIDYEFFFALNFTLFYMDNYDDYLENHVVSFYEKDKPNEIPYIAYYFQQNILLDDKNELFNEITSTEYFTTCFFLQAVKYAQMWQKHGAFEFKFYLSDSVLIIKRSFEKFPNFLIQIITMVHITWVIFKFLSQLWGDYCFFVYIFKIVKDKIDLKEIQCENETNNEMNLQKLCSFKNFLLSKCCPFMQKYSKDLKNFMLINKFIESELGVENLMHNLLGKKYQIVNARASSFENNS